MLNIKNVKLPFLKLYGYKPHIGIMKNCSFTSFYALLCCPPIINKTVNLKFFI